MAGVARRAWARNPNALETIINYNRANNGNHITLPYLTNEEYIKDLVQKKYMK